MKKISQHITYAEAIKSNTAIRKGIDNTPSPLHIKRMCMTAEHIFEPPRQHFAVRCSINSFYRCPKLNKAVGSKSMNHPRGESIDSDRDLYPADLYNGKPVTNKMWFEYIYWNCEYRELIWEFGSKENPAWVHGTYRKNSNIKVCKFAEAGKGYREFDPIAEGYISATKPDYC